MEPKDFQQFAKFLLKSPGSRAGLRSAASRSYYAAYHACKVWHDALPAAGENFGPPGGVHQKLINCLRNPKVTDERRARRSRILAAKLEVMRGRRNAADYALETEPTVDDVALQVQQVDSLLADLIEPTTGQHLHRIK